MARASRSTRANRAELFPGAHWIGAVTLLRAPSLHLRVICVLPPRWGANTHPRPWDALIRWRSWVSQGLAVERGILIRANPLRGKRKAAAKTAAFLRLGGFRWVTQQCHFSHQTLCAAVDLPGLTGFIKKPVVRSVTSNLEADEELLKSVVN